MSNRIDHTNFYDRIPDLATYDTSRIRVIRAAEGADWCHVVCDGRIVDQGHEADVNDRLVGAFFDLRYADGIGKVDLVTIEDNRPPQPIDLATPEQVNAAYSGLAADIASRCTDEALEFLIADRVPGEYAAAKRAAAVNEHERRR